MYLYRFYVIVLIDIYVIIKIFFLELFIVFLIWNSEGFIFVICIKYKKYDSIK